MSVVPSTSATGLSGDEFVTIGNNPSLLTKFINERQKTPPNKTLFDVSDDRGRIILTFTEN